MTRPTLTTTAGAPVRRQPEQPDRRPARPRAAAGLAVAGEARPPEPRARQSPSAWSTPRAGAPSGTFTVTNDLTRYTPRRDSSPKSGQSRPSCWPGSPPWPASRVPPMPERDVRGFAVKFLHRGRQLGPGRQQHAGVLRPRPDEVPPISSAPRSATRRPTCARPPRCGTFWSLSPESLHQITILMSDRGLPVLADAHERLRQPHASAFWNADGERFWVKFHFKTRQGHAHFTNDEAAAIVGHSRETYQEALFGAIEAGEPPAVDALMYR